MSSLMPSLLPIMGWFAVGSLVGGTYYMLLSRLRRRPGGEGIVLAILLALPIIWSLAPTFLGTFWMLTDSFVSIPFLGGLMACMAGAFAERKIEPAKSSFSTCGATLWCAGLLGLATCLVILFFTGFPFKPGDEGQMWALLAGIMTAPSAIPTFIYLWRSSQTRPGVDRPLNSSEISALER